jgi:hypothetical protein
MSIEPHRKKFILYCDVCGAVLGWFGTFRKAQDAKDPLGVTSYYDPDIGEWVDRCRSCSANIEKEK